MESLSKITVTNAEGSDELTSLWKNWKAVSASYAGKKFMVVLAHDGCLQDAEVDDFLRRSCDWIGYDKNCKVLDREP